MLRSPWLGMLAIAVAGIVGYALSDTGTPASTTRTLDAVTVTIRPTRDTGAGWDFGGGLPDPKITVQQGDRVLATCEAKDQLETTCRVGAPIDRTQGPVRVVVVDVDSSDDDAVGELALALDEPTTHGDGAIQSVAIVAHGGAQAASPWQRFRALWIALAIGLATAVALALHRRRHA